MLKRHDPCRSFKDFPCSTNSRKHACAHVTNALRHACNARRPAYREPTRNPWRAVSLWIWNAPIFAGLPLPRSPGAVNTCKPSARSARTRAAAAQPSAASTAWITASAAPRRASAVKTPALQWLTEHTCQCRETKPRADNAASYSLGGSKSESHCILDSKCGSAVSLRSAHFGVGGNTGGCRRHRAWCSASSSAANAGCPRVPCGPTLAALIAALAACATAPAPTSRMLMTAPAQTSFDGNVTGQATDQGLILVTDPNPATPRVSLAAGDPLRIEMPAAFRRNTAVAIAPDADTNLILTKGWPQGSVRLAGQYRVGYDEKTHGLTVTALQDVAICRQARMPISRSSGRRRLRRLHSACCSGARRVRRSTTWASRHAT